MEQINPTQSLNTTSAIRKKIGKNVKMDEVFTREKIQECESIIEKAHATFFNDVLDIWQSMIEDFALLSENPEKNALTTKKIAENASKIKGKLDAVGYSLGMKIAKSLQEFSEKDKTPQQHMIIYSKHIDAMNTVIKNNMKGDGETLGREIIKALNALIRKLTEQSTANQQN